MTTRTTKNRRMLNTLSRGLLAGALTFAAVACDGDDDDVDPDLEEPVEDEIEDEVEDEIEEEIDDDI